MARLRTAVVFAFFLALAGCRSTSVSNSIVGTWEGRETLTTSTEPVRYEFEQDGRFVCAGSLFRGISLESTGTYNYDANAKTLTLNWTGSTLDGYETARQPRGERQFSVVMVSANQMFFSVPGCAVDLARQADSRIASPVASKPQSPETRSLSEIDREPVVDGQFVDADHRFTFSFEIPSRFRHQPDHVERIFGAASDVPGDFVSDRGERIAEAGDDDGSITSSLGDLTGSREALRVKLQSGAAVEILFSRKPGHVKVDDSMTESSPIYALFQWKQGPSELLLRYWGNTSPAALKHEMLRLGRSVKITGQAKK